MPGHQEQAESSPEATATPEGALILRERRLARGSRVAQAGLAA